MLDSSSDGPSRFGSGLWRSTSGIPAALPRDELLPITDGSSKILGPSTLAGASPLSPAKDESSKGLGPRAVATACSPLRPGIEGLTTPGPSEP